MRNKFLSVAVIIFTVSVAFAQKSEKQIAAIRTEVKRINKNASSYNRKTESIEGISLEGTEATYYSSGKSLKKISAKIYGETYRATAELFYRDEQLIFAFQRVEKYDTQIAVDPPPKVVKIEEIRSYFANGKMIGFLQGKKVIKPGNAAFKKEEKDTVEFSDKLKAVFWNKFIN